MSRIALMFPGQGSQYVGMGSDFFNHSNVAKEFFVKADKALGFDLSSLMFKGEAFELGATQNTQPALLTVCTAILAAIKEKRKDFHFDGVIGHSLGEYSAYVASGRIDFDSALSLTRKRGLLMSEADKEGKGGMAAILKMEDSQIEDILKEFKNVVAANYNSPGQLVISGSKDEINEVLVLVKEKGGRGILLPVSGAFHSPFMKPIAENFENDLKNITFNSSTIPLYSNIDASILQVGGEVESLKTQLYSSVLFTQSIRNMIKDGFSTFIEVGPGKVLQGLVKKIDPLMKTMGFEKIEDLT